MTSVETTTTKALKDAFSQNDQHPHPGLPKIFYDSAITTFWVEDDRGSWMRVTTGDVKLRLRKQGYRPKSQDGERLSQVDSLVVDIQNAQNIDYAGSLAGWHAGVHEINGKRVLVRDSPVFIDPEPGEWPLLEGIILRMLESEQQAYLFGWLKIAIESLCGFKFRVGQALCLAGPKDCGKSLLQDIITLLLGGRSQKPHRYMNGGTQFNEELFGAEHLMLEDEEASTDIRARRNLGSKIKEICANKTHSCHPKYRTALHLTPFWRLSISLNDEPEALLILPPMDESLLDKFIILKAAKHGMPLPTATQGQRDIFMNALRNELPQFVNFLLSREIPDQLVSQRYGITHFHHPEILQALGTLSPENRPLEMIDTALFDSTAPGVWEGSASKLERELAGDNSAVRREANKLFTFPTACGTYLGRLEKLYPFRFKKTHTSKGNSWEISPPEEVKA